MLHAPAIAVASEKYAVPKLKFKYSKNRVVKMKINFKSKHFAIVAVVALVLAAVYFLGAPLLGKYLDIWPDNGPSDTENAAETVAKCLAEKGAVMYGSEYCGYCNKQKELFGEAFQYITYVECTEQAQLCQENGVRSVPAWEINGQLRVGFKSLDELALMAGCTLG